MTTITETSPDLACVNTEEQIELTTIGSWERIGFGIGKEWEAESHEVWLDTVRICQEQGFPFPKSETYVSSCSTSSCIYADERVLNFREAIYRSDVPTPEEIAAEEEAELRYLEEIGSAS